MHALVHMHTREILAVGTFTAPPIDDDVEVVAIDDGAAARAAAPGRAVLRDDGTVVVTPPDPVPPAPVPRATVREQVRRATTLPQLRTALLALLGDGEQG